MVLNEAEITEETLSELQNGADPSTPKLTKHLSVSIPSSPEAHSDHRSKRRRVLDFLKARPSKEWLKNLNLSSPFGACLETVDEHEQISLSVPSPAGIRRRFHIHFVRKINWSSTLNICIEWLKNPMNVALVIWLLCVAVSATMLALLLVGLLDGAFPSEALRDYWIEINNQVLNALFTLICLYQHPNLFHHVSLLCRWRSEDVVELRKIYCKNGSYRPHEWAHMMVVVILLHISCFSQYVLCGLYWEYTSDERPEFAETFFVVMGTATPVIAGVYTVYSPLGKEYESESDEEAALTEEQQCKKIGLKLYGRRISVSEPEWAGGLLDCDDDLTVCCLSYCCTCCVFGWNMERLGFGNMYVHMFLFLLLCVAPFFIFNVSALNIHNDVIADVVGITGRVLSVFGLLYGGYWRIEMRRKYKLPGNSFFCGSETLTDYIQWMFCWSCALAQEVRTVNLYDIEDDSLYRKNLDSDEEIDPSVEPLSGNGTSSTSVVRSSEIEGACSIPVDQADIEEDESSKLLFNDAMAAPAQPSMRLEDSICVDAANHPSPESTLMQKGGDAKLDINYGGEK